MPRRGPTNGYRIGADARARSGQRVHDHAPHGHWNTTTLLGSIRLDGTVSCLAIDGRTTPEVFRE